jgi:hypothetical protein
MVNDHDCRIIMKTPMIFSSEPKDTGLIATLSGLCGVSNDIGDAINENEIHTPECCAG